MPPPGALNRQLAYKIVRIGARAHTWLESASSLTVSAVFDRTFYLSDGAGNFVCIGDSSIGDGPVNAVLATRPDDRWHDFDIRAGGRAERQGQQISLERGPLIEFSRCVIWQPAPWPALADASNFGSALRTVIDLASTLAPSDGLFSAVLPVRSPKALIAQAVLQTATPIVATLRNWLAQKDADAPDMDSTTAPAVHRLLGLGSGLTPSGDDLLAGLLMSLHATGQRSRATRLAGFIASASQGSTSDLSRALLQCAIDGEPSEPLHGLLSAVIAADIPAIAPALRCLAQIGHTSGWDMLAGAILGLGTITRNDQAD